MGDSRINGALFKRVGLLHDLLLWFRPDGLVARSSEREAWSSLGHAMFAALGLDKQDDGARSLEVYWSGEGNECEGEKRDKGEE